jgi:ribonuclease D
MKTVYIDSQEALLTFADHLSSCSWCGVDSEFLREQTYFPKLCLIQVITQETIACIDPLSIEDLSTLFEALNSPSLIKLFHSARQDLEVFFRESKKIIQPIFDTQMAAAFLGFRAQLGYAALVSEYAKIDLEKKQTRTDWSKRPLSQGQIAYALDDVRYLPTLHEKLAQKLDEKGYTIWFLEAMDELVDEEAFLESIHYSPERLNGFRRLHAVEKQTARSLVEWREATAQELDRPRRWLLDDKQITHLAQKHKTMSGTQIKEYLKENRSFSLSHLDPLHAALQSASSETEKAAEKPADLGRRPTRKQESQLKTLTKMLSDFSEESGIAVELLATRRDLQRYLMGDQDIRFLKGWRQEAVGAELNAILES